jgi:bifunctional non-homologous end joining protein LigD
MHGLTNVVERVQYRRPRPDEHRPSGSPQLSPAAHTADMASPPQKSVGTGAGGMIRPMLATRGPVPSTSGWAFEIKFDGVRAIGYAGPAGMRLLSRNDRDISGSYPEVAGLDLGRGVVVDGELVAWDERGRPDFARLQQRMHLTAPAPGLIAAVPVRYVVFDLLRQGEESLLELPYERRRARLLELELHSRGVVVPASFTDTSGELVLQAAAEQGLEGVVAKRVTSSYQPGRRSRSWVKTAIRRTTEVVIVGWSPATGNEDVVGSLLLAGHSDGGVLVYAGDVGTGFTDAVRRQLRRRLRPLERPEPPFGGDFVRARGWPGRPPGRGRFTGLLRCWSGRSSTGRSPATGTSGTRPGVG